jgi:hypothetical protein
MNTTVTTCLTRRSDQCAPTDLEDAARRLYDAEVALHCAHQTHVDEWIFAASERLHAAVEAYHTLLTPYAA